MNCIITAGPTAEPLDEVRRLTNASTGRLGVRLADFLAAQGCQVTLIRGSLGTYRHETTAQAVMSFTTTSELAACLAASAGAKVDAVFHAAAVSDFTFGRVLDRDGPGCWVERSERKLSTTGRDLVVELRPTPKLIGHLREWFPQALRVGWKFEVDGGRSDALAQARLQIRREGTHACVANGPAYGVGFGVVTEDGACRHLADAEALYEGLWRLMQRFSKH